MWWLLGIALAADLPMGSIVMVHQRDQTCTGAVVEPNVVATTRQCGAQGRPVEVNTRDGRVLKGRVRSSSVRLDLAILDVEALDLTPVVPRAHTLPPTERVFAVGHVDHRSSWAVIEGVVSLLGSGEGLFSGLTGPGQRGAAVLDEQGAFVGLLSDESTGRSQPFLIRYRDIQEQLQAPARHPISFRLETSVGSWIGTSRQSLNVGFSTRLDAVVNDRFLFGISTAPVLHSAGPRHMSLLTASTGYRFRFASGSDSIAIDVRGGLSMRATANLGGGVSDYRLGGELGATLWMNRVGFEAMVGADRYGVSPAIGVRVRF